MAVERYLVRLSVVFELEDPDAFLSWARSKFDDAAPQEHVDMFLPDAAAALTSLLDPSAMTLGLPGVAVVRQSVGAELLPPPPPGVE